MCPECSRHQVWRAKAGTERLDRGCEHCGKRVRAKLDRSSSGQGRRRSVRIWERGGSVSQSELEQEVRRRDIAADESGSGPSNMVADVSSQTTLPNIWGAGWEPRTFLEFSSPLESEAARNEFLRFFAERHDGHLELVSDAWEECGPPSSFNGCLLYTSPSPRDRG